MSAPRRRRGGRLLVAGFVALALVAVVGVLGVGAVLYGRTQLEPVQTTHDTQVIVAVSSGEGLDQLSDDLYAHHLIRSSFFFRWYARFKGLGGSLHTGNFRLDEGMGASAVISKLAGSADVALRHLVLAEGLTADQMASKVEQATGITAADYLNEVRKGSFNGQFIDGAPTTNPAGVEGFLFPDTYDVATGLSAHDLVQLQLDTFGRKAAARLGSAPKGLNGYQLVILASILEREARRPEDRNLVAGIILNRLQRNMLLQVDATVVYGLGKPGQSPSAADLQQDTPYNSYLHTGLPPTPINNPGVDTLTRAAQPLASEYIFYVSDGCGVIHPSKTETEHERLIATYVGKPCSQ